MVETEFKWDSIETHAAFTNYRMAAIRAFHRELCDLAHEVCHRIRKEVKARSHKQVMHYPKKFEGALRTDLVIALNQIYTMRARSRRRYIAADMVIDRIQSTRHFLPTLAKFFKSVAQDYQTFDTQLATIEGGLMLLGNDP